MLSGVCAVCLSVIVSVCQSVALQRYDANLGIIGTFRLDYGV